jgi:hypothetical protein
VNTAIFSICSAVLLKPLPYADPDRIVMLWERLDTGALVAVAPANFVDWREQTHSFSAIAAINPFSSFVLTGSGEAVRLAAAGVSWNFFSHITSGSTSRFSIVDTGRSTTSRFSNSFSSQSRSKRPIAVRFGAIS